MTFLGVCLTTNDVLGLTEFYKTLLQTTANGNETHMELATKGAFLAIYNNGDIKEAKNKNASLCFEVNDVDYEYKRLLTLGVNIIMPPKTQPWGRRAMQIADPDGTIINLSCKI